MDKLSRESQYGSLECQGSEARPLAQDAVEETTLEEVPAWGWR